MAIKKLNKINGIGYKQPLGVSTAKCLLKTELSYLDFLGHLELSTLYFFFKLTLRGTNRSKHTEIVHRLHGLISHSLLFLCNFTKLKNRVEINCSFLIRKITF